MSKKQVDPVFTLNLERFLPSGCDYCGEPADRRYPAGPISVVIADPAPDAEYAQSSMFQFCNWKCLACWAAKVADGRVASKP